MASRYMERGWMSLIIREMHIKTTVTYMSHPLEWLLLKTQDITNVGKDVEKRGPLYTVDGNVNWYSYIGKRYRNLSQNYKQNYHIPTLLLGMYPKEMKSPYWRNTCTPTFTAAFFTTATTWQQPKCGIDDG